MSARTLVTSLGITAAAVLGACSSSTAPGDSRVMGILEVQFGAEGSLAPSAASDASSRTVISAPDSVEAGVPFTATITTIGLSGCWEAAGEDIELDRNLAVVVPYDLDGMREGVACTGSLIELPHPVEIRFAEPGEATLRVRGRKVFKENIQRADTVVVEKRIVVR